MPIGREFEYADAAVGPHDGTLDTLVWPKVHAEARGVFWTEVSRRPPDEFIGMALDGAGGHQAKWRPVPANRRWVSRPPWSPQLNPTEQGWNEVRENWLANRIWDHREQVDDQLVTAWATLQADPQRIASLGGFDWIRSIPMKAN